MGYFKLVVSGLFVLMFAMPVWSDDYIGLYEKTPNNSVSWSVVGLDNFLNEWKENLSKNLRLIDVEIVVSGDVEEYLAVFQAGNDRASLSISVDEEGLQSELVDMQKYGMYLADFEVIVYKNDVRYLAVFREGQSVNPIFYQTNHWDEFSQKITKLSDESWVLNDFESYVKEGVRYFSGVFEKTDQKFAYVHGEMNWDDFMSSIIYHYQENLHLVELEKYVDHDQEYTFGLFKQGSMDQSFWRMTDLKTFKIKQEELISDGFFLKDLSVFFKN